MNKTATFKDLFHQAGIAGLVLTPLCVVEFLFSNATVGSEQAWMGIVGTLLKIVKIAGCIWILRYYMAQFKAAYPGSTRAQVRLMGVFSGFLSALILGALSMAYYEWHPEIVRETMDAFYQIYQQMNMLTKEVKDVLRMFEANFPHIMFWSELIRCTLIGWIFSAILASRIAPSNPFEGETQSEE